MKKVNLSKKLKISIVISVVVVLIATAVVCALLFLKKGVTEQIVLTNEKSTFEDDVKGYKEGVTDNAGNMLVYNPDNAFVAIKKSASKGYFMPCGKSAADDKKSAILTLTVRDRKGNSYIMNSTDNSVDFKTFEIAEEKNSLKITFSLFKDKESAKKGFEKNGFSIEIPVMFSTENGNFKVSINCREIKLSSGLVVEKIAILPGLFSVRDALNGEHFLVPDGSGALIDLSVEVPEKISLSLPVYGSDISVGDYNDGAFIPCYAFSDGKNTNCVIISEGEALATINCNRQKKMGAGNIYSEFTLTPYSSTESAVKISDSYEGEIALTYVFSDTEVNSYSTLALIARDSFVKKDYLSDNVQYDFGDLPFFVNVIGSEKGNSKAYTTFEDATEIISLLNSKGVRNVALRFSGALDGGLKGDSISKSPVLKSLGGSEGLSGLCKLASDKRSSVWVDINTFSGGTALAGTSGVVKTSLYGDLYSYMAKENVESVVSDSTVFGKNVSSAYSLSASTENLNIALNDASFLLFTDSNKNLDRQEMLEFTKEKVSALSVGSGLMLDKPSLWLMKGASAVYSVPDKCSIDGGYGVTSVPILQMVLHGSLVYGGEPVNATKGGWNSVLKSVELGAVPSFLFTYEECNDLSYGAYATVTAQYYSKLKGLKAIQEMAITSHEKLLTGVYKIIYGYNKVVYVNYNDSVVTVDGILLSPQDFILV